MSEQNTYFLIDFDSTLVDIETLEELARIALENDKNKKEKIEKIKNITELGMNGSMNFEDSLKERFDLLNLHESHINQLKDLLKQHITASAIKNKEWFKEHAQFIYIISGGFKELIIPVATVLGIDPTHVYANELIFNDDRAVIGFDQNNLLAQSNGKERQARALDLKGAVVVIGDGITDYEMKKAYPNSRFLYFAENVRREGVMRMADDILYSFDVLCS